VEAVPASGAGVPSVGDCRVSFYLYDDNGKITDTDIYNYVYEASVEAYDGQGNRYALSSSLQGDSYIADGNNLPEGSYTLIANLRHTAFDRVSTPVAVELLAPAAAATPAPTQTPTQAPTSAPTQTPTSTPTSTPRPTRTPSPVPVPDEFPWLIVIIIAVAVLCGGGAAVYFLLIKGGGGGGSAIRANLEIIVSNNNGHSVHAYNRDMFFNSNISRSDLNAVIGYTGESVGDLEAADAAEAVLITGTKDGINIFTKKKNIKIRGGRIRGNSHFLNTTDGYTGDSVDIDFNDASETHVTVTTRDM
jgi:hypothetical protein